MLNGYSIIDADSHVVEPPTMWAEYLEPEFKHFAPSPEMKIKGEDIVEKLSPQVSQEGNRQMMEAHPNAYLRHYDAESHVQAMVQMGVDIAFLNWVRYSSNNVQTNYECCPKKFEHRQLRTLCPNPDRFLLQYDEE